MADGVIILSSPLWLERDALPKSTIEVGGREVTIYCPRVPRDRGEPHIEFRSSRARRRRGRAAAATNRGIDAEAGEVIK